MHNQILYAQALMLGMVMSLPFGAAASLIIDKAYFEGHASAMKAVMIPIIFDLTGLIIISNARDLMANLITFYEPLIDGVLGIFIVCFGLYLLTRPASENYSTKIVHLAWINIITSQIAFFTFFQSMGIALDSFASKYVFAAGFISGSAFLWALTIILISENRNLINEFVPPQKLRKFLSCVIMAAGGILVTKSLFL